VANVARPRSRGSGGRPPGKMRSDIRDVVAGVKQGLDLAVEDPGVGGVMHHRADDDVHVETPILVFR